LPDTGLQACSARQRRAVVALLRQLRPAFLLIPHPADPHPDHREASLLLQGVAFLAAVKGFAPEVGEPHRPQLILAYPGPRQLGEPPLVVEVTASYARKLEALACYDSQFAPSAGPPTHLASGYFLPAVEGRDRAYGNLIGAERGEGFFPLSPINASALRGFLARVVCASA
ncbi:MAG: hypothetical protein N2447_09600, partial [Thermoanaerobaculum sp.]|nr:hypothetical protein [Thermoanaerobaculum sp.]